MEPGTRVESSYTPPQRPASDLDRLISFMTTEFATETLAIAGMQREAWQYPDRRLLHALGGRALAFRQLLGHWEPIARSLYETQLATNLSLEREEHGKSRTGEEIKLQSKRYVSDLKVALDQISNERDQMKEIAFWSRSQVQHMLVEEMTGEAAGVPDLPVGEPFRFPPAGKGLDKLR